MLLLLKKQFTVEKRWCYYLASETCSNRGRITPVAFVCVIELRTGAMGLTLTQGRRVLIDCIFPTLSFQNTVQKSGAIFKIL